MCWVWWTTLVLLMLRMDVDAAVGGRVDVLPSDATSSQANTTVSPTTTTTVAAKPKNALELGVPNCDSNVDCVSGGVCRKTDDGRGVCMCPQACPANIPARCGRISSHCIILDEHYRQRFALPSPLCHMGQCVCPPMFDALHVSPRTLPLKLNTTLQPIKCDKRDLQVVGRAFPSESVYKGSDVTLFCCINVDPEDFVDAGGVFFIQNTTLMREATSHPFREDTSSRGSERLSCWELEIKNVQPSDSGSYMCLVTTSKPVVNANYTIEFEVKEHQKRYHATWYKRPKKVQVQTSPVVAPLNLPMGSTPPRMIHNLKVNASERTAVVTWDSEEGSLIPIDLRLLRRTDNRGQEVFRRENATPPVLVEGLRAATPYTLFVSGKDGTIPFEFTEHFTTQQRRPHAPKEEDVRLLNSGSSLICEVEWKSPAETNGRITDYFVSLRGQMRRPRPDGALVEDDFPPASDTDKRCVNWDGVDETSAVAGINPIDFSTEFYSCKFGPLKPNRNYSVMVWAENTAGRSQPTVFKKNCVTNFAQPDVVSEPTTVFSGNQSTFGLAFTSPPDDTNGPISCFYIAVVPLPANVSLDVLPPPSEIVMDSFVKAFSNNLHESAAERRRYFAYIAESYGEYPATTVIGDGLTLADIRPCNVQYLSRYTAEDQPLKAGLKYTGFLIVRVDKEEDLERKSDREHGSKFLKSVVDGYRERTTATPKAPQRTLRQLHLSGPAYGYSSYFKPILLEDESYSGMGTFLKVLLPILTFLTMIFAVGTFVLHKRGEVMWEWCPLARLLTKDMSHLALLKPAYHAIPADELPSEYIIRHRDTDFLFSQEYEALPNFALDSTASLKNPTKNRYSDIRAFDETRVKLKKIDGDEGSDYINANFVKSWNEKKVFLAAQAPLDHTVADFWRMVWEHDVYLVVMVTNLAEKSRAKCSKYWPDEEPLESGDVIVSPVDATYFADYSIRTFDVVCKAATAANRFSPTPSFGACNDSHASSEYANVPTVRHSSSFAGCRRVTQYHYNNWSDYKAPASSTGLLRFIHTLRQLPEFNESPVVIHCSAGVGRTGTFIAIDSMLDQCEAEGKADVFGFVCKLRQQRNLMVQSADQYVFIYKALAEWHLYGYTDMDAGEFEDHYRTLVEPSMRDRTASFGALARIVSRDGVLPVTGIEAEFKKLERTLEAPAKTSFAMKEENRLKNRFDAAVPYDKNRVVLSPTMGFADSSYINASHIKGYFYPYIVAQDPVSEATAFDFWRMIADQNVATVVMLSNEEDWSFSEKYWPEELRQEHVFRQGQNRVSVTMTDEDRQAFYVQRTIDFELTQTEEKFGGQVAQFAFTGWPSEADGGHAVPAESTPLLALIMRVLERQSTLVESGPILVHCRNGSSEAGVYCCISLLLLRFKAEQRVDVFQTVKDLQTQRPMMFTRLEQYDFCYKAVSDYITHR